jgi:hypothetical protein
MSPNPSGFIDLFPPCYTAEAMTKVAMGIFTPMMVGAVAACFLGALLGGLVRDGLFVVIRHTRWFRRCERVARRWFFR